MCENSSWSVTVVASAIGVPDVATALLTAANILEEKGAHDKDADMRLCMRADHCRSVVRLQNVGLQTWCASAMHAALLSGKFYREETVHAANW